MTSWLEEIIFMYTTSGGEKVVATENSIAKAQTTRADSTLKVATAEKTQIKSATELESSINKQIAGITKEKQATDSIIVSYNNSGKAKSLLIKNTQTLTNAEGVATKVLTSKTIMNGKEAESTLLAAGASNTLSTSIGTQIAQNNGWMASLRKTEESFNTLRWAMVNMFFVIGAASIIAAPFIALTRYGMELETMFTRISMITGESTNKISEDINKLRQNTIFSTKEMGDGFLEFTKQGFSSQEAVKAMPAISALATTGFVDMKEATQITEQMLHVYNLNAEEAWRVSNSLAKAAAISAADVSTFGIAMSYAAPSAESLGVSLEETEAAVGLLMNAGLRSSKAGTALAAFMDKVKNKTPEAQQVLSELGVTVYDSEGKFIGLSETINRLALSMSKLTSEQRADAVGKLFELRGERAVDVFFNSIASGTTTLEEFQSQLEGTNFAMENMGKVGETTAGKLKTSIENLKSSLQPAADSMNKFFASIITSLTNITDSMQGKEASSGLVRYVQQIEMLNDYMKSGVIKSDYQYITVMDEINTMHNLGAYSAEDYRNEITKLNSALDDYNKKKSQGTTEKPSMLPGVTTGILSGFEQSKGSWADAYVEYQKESTIQMEEQAKNQKAAAEAVQLAINSYASKILSLKDKIKSELMSSGEKQFFSMGELFKPTENEKAVMSKESLDNLASWQKKLSDAQTEYAELDASIKADEVKLKDYDSTIKDLNRDLQDQNKILSDYNNKLSETNSTISKLSSARFTGQTQVDILLRKLEIYQKKQELAARGITDPYQYLQDALKATEGEYDNFYTTIEKTNTVLATSQDTYNAWRDTVKEFISDAITQGNLLGKNVSGAISKFATSLLSTSKYSEQSSSSTESQINNLKDAYEVYYGEQENQVKDAIQLHEDEVNGVYTGSTTIIDALKAQWSLQTQYNTAIADAKSRITDLNGQIDVQREYYDNLADSIQLSKTKMDELYTSTLKAIQAQIDLNNTGSSSGGSTGSTGSGGGSGGTTVARYYFINDQYKYKAMREGATRQAAMDKLTSSVSTFPNGKKATWNETTQSTWNSKSSYTALAKGGIVNSPTFALIGEAGPEAVVPLTKNILSGTNSASNKLGGATINITSLNIAGVSTNDPNDFAYEFSKAIKRELRTK